MTKTQNTHDSGAEPMPNRLWVTRTHNLAETFDIGPMDLNAARLAGITENHDGLILKSEDLKHCSDGIGIVTNFALQKVFRGKMLNRCDPEAVT